MRKNTRAEKLFFLKQVFKHYICKKNQPVNLDPHVSFFVCFFVQASCDWYFKSCDNCFLDVEIISVVKKVSSPQLTAIAD